MANRLAPLVLALAVSIAACGGDFAPSADVPDSVELPADQMVRTADPYARGYTDDDFPRIQELAAGVYSYEQLRSAGDEKFTTVSLFVVSSEGVLVADGQGSVEETQRMIDEIAEITDQPITKVVVNSDHGDHTAGNSAFPVDVQYYAHPWSIEVVGSAVRDGTETPLWVQTAESVEDKTVLEIGGTSVEIHFLGRAHTGGDLVVYLPEEKIMFMSEAYLHRVFPAMRTAYPSEWVDMIETAQIMDVDIYVPGHGFVDHPSVLADELEVFQGAIRLVIQQAEMLYEEGLSLADAQNQAQFGDLEGWSLRLSQGDRALQQIYAELDGELPGGNQ
jgi:cyclase